MTEMQIFPSQMSKAICLSTYTTASPRCEFCRCFWWDFSHCHHFWYQGAPEHFPLPWMLQKTHSWEVVCVPENVQSILTSTPSCKERESTPHGNELPTISDSMWSHLISFLWTTWYFPARTGADKKANGKCWHWEHSWATFHLPATEGQCNTQI